MLMLYPKTFIGVIGGVSTPVRGISTKFDPRPSGYVNVSSADCPFEPSAGPDGPSYVNETGAGTPSRPTCCTTIDDIGPKFVSFTSVHATTYDAPSHVTAGGAVATTSGANCLGCASSSAPFG